MQNYKKIALSTLEGHTWPRKLWVHEAPYLNTSSLTFAMKAAYAVKGYRCTSNSELLQNYFATYNSEIYEILIKQFTFRGLAVCDQFSMGIGNNSGLELVEPPFGGSSSGSAILVRDRVVDFAIGSSTGGSTSMPATQCKLFSFQGGFGAISRYGLHAYCELLDRPAVLAQTFEVLESVVNLLLMTAQSKDLTKREICLQKEPLSVYVHENDLFFKYLKPILSTHGFEVHSVRTCNPDTYVDFYNQLTDNYAYSNLNRFDGVRFNSVNSNYICATDLSEKVKNRDAALSSTIKKKLFRIQNQGPTTISTFLKNFTSLDDVEPGYHFLFHPISKSWQQLATVETRFMIPNLFNYASMIIPYNSKFSLEILVPANYELNLLAFYKKFKMELNDKR